MAQTDRTPEDCPLLDENGNYVGPERRDPPPEPPGAWHLDKTVSITQIGAIIGVVITGTMLFMNQDKRIDLNNVGIGSNKELIQAETEARRQADLIVIERLTRHEGDQNRTEDRIFEQLDKIHELLRQMVTRGED